MKNFYRLLRCCLLLAPAALYGKDYNIVSFGAVSDTIVVSTAAIQRAIDSCAVRGGRVVIPAGRFATGSIFLKSNVELYLEAGAVLYGSRNLADYTPVKPAYISLRTHEATIQLIYAENAVNVSITGRGEIDGRGNGFEKLSWNDEGITRPHLLRFITCRNVTVRDISLKNSGCWMQHYLACDAVQITGIRINNHNNYNNDGLDLDGCHDVTVSDLTSDSDDDGITLKSTSGRSCENITITNCVVSSHCNAIKLGTESNGGFRNIAISNCVVKPSAVDDTKFFGVLEGTSAISLEMVDGGLLQGVSISNIQVEGTASPIFIRLANRARPYHKDSVITRVGRLQDVAISNVQVLNAGPMGCSITGLPGHPVRGIRLRQIVMQTAGGMPADSTHKIIPEKEKDYPDAGMFGILPANGFYVRHAADISFEDVSVRTIQRDGRPAFFLDDAADVTMRNLQLQSWPAAMADLWMKNCQSVLLTGCSVKGKSGTFANIIGDATSDIVIRDNFLPAGKKVFTAPDNLLQQIVERGN